jgi:outer membrane immunogenic protein
MRRVLLVTTAFGILAATAAAMAADLPYRNQMPVKAPAYAPVFNWTGFYIGVNGGGAFGTSTYNFAGLASTGFDTSGGLIGGTIGFNYQMGSVVFGVEGDGDWSSISGNSLCLGGLFTCQTKNDWLATVRGRVGYAFDRVLPYVTGGAAFGDIKVGVPAQTIDTTNTGWTLGGGIEYAFMPNWSAKFEYLYVDLGNVGCGLACAGIVPTKVDFTTNVVRAGLNYRF